GRDHAAQPRAIADRRAVRHAGGVVSGADRSRSRACAGGRSGHAACVAPRASGGRLLSPGRAGAAVAAVEGVGGAGGAGVSDLGGIMLPNHAPLLIAEQFGTLEALFPGRIDLGLGRAPGTDQDTLRALRRAPAAADSFPQDVLELQLLLSKEAAGRSVQAVP